MCEHLHLYQTSMHTHNKTLIETKKFYGKLIVNNLLNKTNKFFKVNNLLNKTNKFFKVNERTI